MLLPTKRSIFLDKNTNYFLKSHSRQIKLPFEFHSQMITLEQNYQMN